MHIPQGGKHAGQHPDDQLPVRDIRVLVQHNTDVPERALPGGKAAQRRERAIYSMEQEPLRPELLDKLGKPAVARLVVAADLESEDDGAQARHAAGFEEKDKQVLRDAPVAAVVGLGDDALLVDRQVER